MNLLPLLSLWIPLKQFQGKVLLIVNTASKCGFTPQYSGLEELHKKYASRGFEVLAFPCNQFGGQEPGDAVEIKNFCSLTYNVTFPLFSKVAVNGKDAHPLFRFLKHAKPGLLGQNQSNGTSQSSWLIAMAPSSNAMRR